MKKLSIYLLTCFCLLNSHWAFCFSNPHHIKLKYWIFFKDKKSTTQFLPECVLSPQSIERRNNAGIVLQTTDLPLSALYVDSLQKLGIHILNKSRWLNAVSAELDQQQVAVLSELGFIQKIQAVKKLHTTQASKLSLAKNSETAINFSHQNVDYGQSYIANDMLGNTLLHKVNATGKGIRIAVFDNGFRGVDTIPAFNPMFQENRFLGGYDFVDNDANIFKGGSHGTNVLSIMAAYQPGTIVGTGFGASYYLLRTENDASETPLEEDNWVAAAEWADSAGAHIFQTSLGYSTFDNPEDNYTYENLDGNTTIITRAADLAASKGILVLNSAGNEGNKSWKYIIAPADGDSVLAIGAVDSERNRAVFSSYGPTADGRIKPDLMAMGHRVIVLNTDGTARQGSGTSFSCPMVSGFVACLWQIFPQSSANDMRKALLKSADRYNAPNNEYGYGIPHAKSAILHLLAEQNFSLGLSFQNQHIYLHNAQTHAKLTELYDLYTNDDFVLSIVDAAGRAVIRENFQLSELPLALRQPQAILPNSNNFYALTVYHKSSGVKLLSKKFILLFND